jgi:hypothetical protein
VPHRERVATVRVYIDGKPARQRARFSGGRRRTVAVDLRGLAAGTVRIRIVARTRATRLIERRRYRLCAPGRRRPLVSSTG